MLCLFPGPDPTITPRKGLKKNLPGILGGTECFKEGTKDKG